MILKGKARKNPPYMDLNAKKVQSLGKIMTLKQALNLWWNSVRLVTRRYGSLLCYKCSDGTYALCKNDGSFLSIDYDKQKKLLTTKIKLDPLYRRDADDYPVVAAIAYDEFNAAEVADALGFEEKPNKSIVDQYNELSLLYNKDMIWLKGDYNIYVKGKIVTKTKDLIVVEEK